MEEKNELNDIILNKGGSNAGSKKLLLAIATLTLILIIVLVIMNSLKNDEVQKAPQAILPPEPTAPTEIINDPLFEPVEVIQEGNATAQTGNLDQVAQKIKQESLQNTPVQEQAEPITPAPVVKTTIQTAPVVTKPAPVVKSATPPPAPKAEKAIIKKAPAAEKTPKAAEAKKTVKAPAIPTTAKPVIKSESVQTAPAAPIKTAEPKTEPKVTAPSASNGQGTYYIQVGSFTKEPNKALFDRLNGSGMKYTTQKVGETTKILVGPFQGEKAVQDAMGNVRQNIEARAFKIKG